MTNTAHCCDTYGMNFAGVQLRVLANLVIPFYIESPLALKIVAMQRAILKIIVGLAYLILDLIYDLKVKSMRIRNTVSRR
jgi:hypothetical protein